MIFFNRQVVLSLWFVLLAAGCSTTPPVTSKTTDVATPNAVLPTGPISPHPYYKGKKAAATRAQKQQFAQAQKAMQENHWQQAQSQLEALTQANPKLSGAWVNLGIAFARQDKIDQAQKSYERAISANKNNIAAYNKLAVVLRIQGEFKAALKVYQQAHKVWPYDPDTHRNTGILYDIYLGQWDNALVHYQAAQALLEAPDTRLDGWVIDLERRMAARARQEDGK